MTPPTQQERDWYAELREASVEYRRRVARQRDPSCRQCFNGYTTGYVAPSKEAVYPCLCTGEASWQR